MKVSFVGKTEKEIKDVIKKSITETLRLLGQNLDKLEVCVNFMTCAEIKELNKNTRNIDRVTDVLSFPAFTLRVGELIDVLDENNAYAGVVHLGDMALCLDRAKEQSEEYGTSLIEEVSKLAVHSTLHLMGYDHIEDRDFMVMQPKEDEIKDILKSKKII
ncbi:MAG: rRNA maturation RNase YbeY [Clostridia bacterium]|nr:rRNA maturation RNase YbeY [Clostridia bacterium]